MGNEVWMRWLSQVKSRGHVIQGQKIQHPRLEDNTQGTAPKVGRQHPRSEGSTQDQAGQRAVLRSSCDRFHF